MRDQWGWQVGMRDMGQKGSSGAEWQYRIPIFIKILGGFFVVVSLQQLCFYINLIIT